MSRNIVHRSIWTAAGAVLFLAMLAQPARAQFGEEMAVIMQKEKPGRPSRKPPRIR